MEPLFKDRPALPFHDITHAWAAELREEEGKLGRALLISALNGEMDDAGPEVDENRYGLRIVTPDCQAGIVCGMDLRPLLPYGQDWRGSPWNSLYLTREAVLAFAAAKGLTPPSWWRPAAQKARQKPEQAAVDRWMQNYCRKRKEDTGQIPKRDNEVFPECKAATGATVAQMKQAAQNLPEELRRPRGGRDR